ncbi:MAG: formylglycine-generating enzyme family protein [Alistipes sp.]|nr:formylglycine-generating enzyme family protein [Alistipes sp.]
MIIDEREVEVSSSRISFRLTITDPATAATSATAPATSATTATTASATSVSSVNAAPDALPQIEMVFVKGGTFTMGATPEQGKAACGDEKPAHSVTVSDFYIGKYEVSQAQWEAVMGENPSHYKGENRPVESVSWNDIQEFIEKLNAKTGKKYRLPTEAEWEYAARGGDQSKGYKYSGSNNIDEVAWYGDNSASRTTHIVGQKQPNELGLYDMSGNVWECCSDWYWSKYYKNALSDNPTGPATGSGRVLRGGGYSNYASSCRVSTRFFSGPSDRFLSCGFRLVCQP